MDDIMLKALHYIKFITKNKPSSRNVLSYIEIFTSSKIKLVIAGSLCIDIIASGVINDLKVLNLSFRSNHTPEDVFDIEIMDSDAWRTLKKAR